MPTLKRYLPEFHSNFKLALPIMFGQFGQILVNVVDNIMVGQLGAAPLAAISLAIAVYVIFLITGIGISFALPPLVAEANGAKKHKRITPYFNHSLVINLLYALGSIVLVELIIPVLPYIGHDPEVVKLAIPYLRLSAYTLIPIMIFQTVRCFSEGMSETIPPMIAILAGNILNVFFNYVLIFGKMGMPALGVTGAAIGTLLARILMLVLLVVILFFWKDLWQYIKLQFLTLRRSIFNEVYKIGVPVSLQLFFEVSGFAGAALLMGIISKEAQAAHQIAINLSAVTFLICSGLGMACTVRVGNKLGEQNRDGMRLAGLSAIVQVICFMFVCAMLFVMLRHWLPTIYISDGAVVSIASILLVMAAIFQIPDGVQVVVLGALRGIQDVKVPTLITFIAYWIFGLPISYLSAFHLGMGPIGIWLGLVAGLVISSSLLTMRFLHKTG